MSDRDAIDTLIRRYVAAFNAGGIEGMFDVDRQRQAQVTSCHNLQDGIAQLALG